MKTMPQDYHKCKYNISGLLCALTISRADGGGSKPTSKDDATCSFCVLIAGKRRCDKYEVNA